MTYLDSMVGSMPRYLALDREPAMHSGHVCGMVTGQADHD
jgi:hypothetical protein